MSIITAPKLAIRNKNTLQNCKKVGCYKCLKTFDPCEIKEYTDHGETAICPYCDTDAILPETEISNLEEINKYWFN